MTHQVFTNLVEATAAVKAAQAEVQRVRAAICATAMTDLAKALVVTTADHPILEGVLKPGVTYAYLSPTDFHIKRIKRSIPAVYLFLLGGDVGWETGRDTKEPHTTFIAAVQHLVSVLTGMGWNVNEPDFRADGYSVAAFFMN